MQDKTSDCFMHLPCLDVRKLSLATLLTLNGKYIKISRFCYYVPFELYWKKKLIIVHSLQDPFTMDLLVTILDANS